jgi:mercuric transport protein
MHRAVMSINNENSTADSMRRQALLAGGGLLGALAACSCCIVPLILFGLGVSGAWIGSFTRLAPYQPIFIAATLACLGAGAWLVPRASNQACGEAKSLRPAVATSLGEGRARRRGPAHRRCTLLRPLCAACFLVNGDRPVTKSLILVVLAVGLLSPSPVLAAERTITLAVQNMHCATCPFVVKKSLEAVPGVTKVTVSYKDQAAIVTYDDSKADLRALTTATTNAGYPSAPRS